MSCDCPSTAVFMSQETYRRWTIFMEKKTTNGPQNTISVGLSSTTECSSSSISKPDLDDISVLLDSLDPDLRPATPDFNDPRSMEKYEENKQLAKEYWKMQTELALLEARKNQLLALQAEDEQRQRSIRALQEEKETLRCIRDMLEQQREHGQETRSSKDGWVIVPRNERSED